MDPEELNKYLENEEDETKDDTEEQKFIPKGFLHDFYDEDNPYRSESKVNLDDTSKNFRWIETDLLLELIKKDIPSSQLRIWFYILHMTRGYNLNKNSIVHSGGKEYKTTKLHRHTHYIKNKHILKNTGLPKSTVSEGIKRLLDRKMIYEVYDKDDERLLGCNFRYDTWS
jgi:DNA-binding MarR family transcriptional regulator